MPANIIPTAEVDGLLYANAVPLTSNEANLGDGAVVPSVIEVKEGHILVAVVKLSVNGFITGNSTFVFLQTDLGDGTWIDVAWCFYNSTQAPGTFVLCGGTLNANNAFEQVRKSGSAPDPQSNGSNGAIPLGGRVRFAGFSSMTGGSSSAPGVSTQVRATIRYKLQKPR